MKPQISLLLGLIVLAGYSQPEQQIGSGTLITPDLYPYTPFEPELIAN